MPTSRAPPAPRRPIYNNPNANLDRRLPSPIRRAPLDRTRESTGVNVAIGLWDESLARGQALPDFEKPDYGRVSQPNSQQAPSPDPSPDPDVFTTMNDSSQEPDMTSRGLPSPIGIEQDTPTASLASYPRPDSVVSSTMNGSSSGQAADPAGLPRNLPPATGSDQNSPATSMTADFDSSVTSVGSDLKSPVVNDFVAINQKHRKKPNVPSMENDFASPTKKTRRKPRHNRQRMPVRKDGRQDTRGNSSSKLRNHNADREAKEKALVTRSPPDQ